MSDRRGDSSPDGPYAQSARGYSANGWNPLPVFDGGKGKVPEGFTGYAAREVDEADISRWVDDQNLGGSNICLRLMYEIGIDIDSYDDAKEAMSDWSKLCGEYGEPPLTVRVSARFGECYDGLAGIRIYRLPRKYWSFAEQRAWNSQIGSGIDVIRLGQRQVVCWPSIHPKLGTVYQWLDERTGAIHGGPLPSPDSLPELPDVWVENVLLKRDWQRTPASGVQNERRARASDESAHWTPGKPCPAVRSALGKALRELEDGRHDGSLKHMTALTRLGEQGHEGALKAIDTLHSAFMLSTHGEDRDSEGEWRRMAVGVDAVIEADGLTPDEEKGCCGSVGARAKRRAADRVLDLAEELFTLGRTADDRPFIVPSGGANVALFSTRARPALAEAYATEFATTIGDKALKEAWTVLERRALATNPVDLPIRVAAYNAGVVIDMGAADGRCIVADTTGWRIEARSPVTFRRPKPLLPLAEPVRGGNWDTLWDLTNIAGGHRDLVRGWLVCALMRLVPHPILRIKGPQGAVKSTATKTLARVLDPSAGDVAKPPTSAERWEMTVGSRWVVPVDNVSHIPEWWADDLCRTVTGAGQVDRELYSDDEVVVKKLRAAVILNGITMPGEMRPDLLERTLSIEVSRPRIYLSESEVEARVATALPSMLGLVLDDLVAVLGHTGGHTNVSDLRMNDFATILAKLDSTRWTRALAEYRVNLDGLAADALESDPVATTLADFMEDETEWIGSAQQLLNELKYVHPGDVPEKWPKDATRLSQWLLRATTTLLHVGLTVERLPREARGRPLRVRRVSDASGPNDADDADSSYLNPSQREEERRQGKEEGYTNRNSASSASSSRSASSQTPLRQTTACRMCSAPLPNRAGLDPLCAACRDSRGTSARSSRKTCERCRSVFVPTKEETVCATCGP